MSGLTCRVKSQHPVIIIAFQIVCPTRQYLVLHRVALTSGGELLEDKLQNRTLAKGTLLEFKKDSAKVLLAVAVRPDGKKNWMVFDQVLFWTANATIWWNIIPCINSFEWACILLFKLLLDFPWQNGVTSSIKPQQITFIVPGIENFDHKEISDFVKRAEHNLVGSFSYKMQLYVYFSVRLHLVWDFVSIKHMQDPTLLEFAWVELLEENKSVTAEELAEVPWLNNSSFLLLLLKWLYLILQIIFGSSEPLESYCAHLLLSKDDTYFIVAESKGSCSIYGPRPTAQVLLLSRGPIRFAVLLGRGWMIIFSH